MNRAIPLVLASSVLFGAIARGHHSLVGEYDSSQPVRIEGIVTGVQFVNPHPFVFVDVRDSSGSVRSWKLEMDNLHELTQIGFTADTLKHGDRVVVTGHQARRHAHGLYIRRLDRPSDGFRYEQVGFSPRIQHRTN
jgi:hypothetical protein